MRPLSCLVAATAAAALLFVSARTPVSAQEKEGKKQIPFPGAQVITAAPPPGPKGPAPRMPDGKPDLQGIWNGQRLLPNQPKADMQPWAAQRAKERVENYSQADPEARCLPGGVPRATPYHHQIVQTSDLVLILFEGNIHSFRQIFLDRSTHLPVKDLWYGDSIGRWDADTLVVDTVGFNDRFWFGMSGEPHTTQLHVIERYHRRDLGNMEINITIDDPGALNKPWVFNRVATLEPEFEMTEYVCNENNQDPLHLQDEKPAAK